MTKCSIPGCQNPRRPGSRSLYCEYCSYQKILEDNRKWRKQKAMTKAKGRNCKICGEPCHEYRSPYCKTHAVEYYRERGEPSKAYEIETGEKLEKPQRKPREKVEKKFIRATISAQKSDIDRRMDIIEQVEALRMEGRHLEAAALHMANFKTPYRESPKPARVITGNKPR